MKNDGKLAGECEKNMRDGVFCGISLWETLKIRRGETGSYQLDPNLSVFASSSRTRPFQARKKNSDRINLVYSSRDSSGV